MRATYDQSAPKRATNLTVNSDLMRLAKELNIQLSAVMEAALEQEVKLRLEQQWLLENAEAFADYNDRVERVGVFSNGVRLF